MNQKLQRQMKAEVTNSIENTFELEGFELVGQTKKGVAFRSTNPTPEGTFPWVEVQVITKNPEKQDCDVLVKEKLEDDLKKQAKTEKKE